MKIKTTQMDFLSVVFGNKETISSLVLTFLRDRMANMPASVQTLRISAPETPQRIKAISHKCTKPIKFIPNIICLQL